MSTFTVAENRKMRPWASIDRTAYSSVAGCWSTPDTRDLAGPSTVALKAESGCFSDSWTSYLAGVPREPSVQFSFSFRPLLTDPVSVAGGSIAVVCVSPREEPGAWTKPRGGGLQAGRSAEK